MSLLSEGGTDVATHILDQELKMFAYLEPQILKQTSLDYDKTTKNIKALDQYISIKEIIQAAKD